MDACGNLILLGRLVGQKRLHRQANVALQGRVSVWLMKRIDPEFNEADFLEGACDAYYIGDRCPLLHGTHAESH